MADAIEAMISDRPYRQAIKVARVMDELKRWSGTQLDPLVVEAALQLLSPQAETDDLGRTAAEPNAKALDLRRSMQFR